MSFDAGNMAEDKKKLIRTDDFLLDRETKQRGIMDGYHGEHILILSALLLS
jgi:hypothetical protein